MRLSHSNAGQIRLNGEGGRDGPRYAGMNVDVVVVGAGAAGLAATRYLHHEGCKVVCIEASDRIGGRCYTDNSIFGVPFDVGGHWLHYGETNALIPIGRSFGFDIYKASDDATVESGLSSDRVKAVASKVDAQLAKMRTAQTDIAMTEAFVPENNVERTALFLKALSAGRDLDEISMHDWVTAGLEADNWYCREGYGAIVARHAERLPISLSTPALVIRRTPTGAEVETSDGKITARQVIVTVSVGVLAAESIRFDPPFEGSRKAALNFVTMGTYNHCAMLFAERTLPVGSDTLISYPITHLSGSAIRAGEFLCNISGTNLCVFEHVGSFAKELEAAGTDAAIAFALDSMCEIFGSDVAKGFQKGYATRWTANEHTRGSYSGTLPGGAGMRSELKQAHADVIHFAGEAVNEEETVTVSGAHKEGLRAAAEVLGALKS